MDIFRKTEGRPTFIILDSHIGYGSPHKQDTAAAHGEPLHQIDLGRESGYADRYVVNSSVHRPRACRPRVPMPPAKWSRTAALGEDEIRRAKRTTDGPRTRSFWFPMSAALPSRVTWGKAGPTSRWHLEGHRQAAQRHLSGRRDAAPATRPNASSRPRRHRSCVRSHPPAVRPKTTSFAVIIHLPLIRLAA